MNLLKYTRYTLVNTFHNTEVSFLASHNSGGAYAAYVALRKIEWSAHKDSEEYTTAHRKLLRIERILCGMKDCMCGGMIRGKSA